jgi:hypothetical protein
MNRAQPFQVGQKLTTSEWNNEIRELTSKTAVPIEQVISKNVCVSTLSERRECCVVNVRVMLHINWGKRADCM